MINSRKKFFGLKRNHVIRNVACSKQILQQFLARKNYMIRISKTILLPCFSCKGNLIPFLILELTKSYAFTFYNSTSCNHQFGRKLLKLCRMRKILMYRKSTNSIMQFVISNYFFPKNIFHQSPDLIIFVLT